jgi:hypothetical protein
VAARAPGEAGRVGDRVGQSGASLVEHDEAPTDREPAQKAGLRRPGPRRFHVGHEAGNEDQVASAVAQDLVGDVSIATEGVTGDRCLVRRSVAQQGDQRGPVRHTELAVSGRQVVLDGAGAEEQPLGNGVGIGGRSSLPQGGVLGQGAVVERLGGAGDLLHGRAYDLDMGGVQGAMRDSDGPLLSTTTAHGFQSREAADRRGSRSAAAWARLLDEQEVVRTRFGGSPLDGVEIGLDVVGSEDNESVDEVETTPSNDGVGVLSVHA